MNSDYQLILASNSPRRKQLLKESGFDFETYTLDVDESYPLDMPAAEIAVYLALKKNDAYRKSLKEQIIITADTTVIYNGKLLEKPVGDKEAREMISTLSGHSHSVVTGVVISNESKSVSFQEETLVTFRNFVEEEIKHYVQKYRPYDKAGAYGIQEWIGLVGVEKIVGSYFNVMGLPTYKVYEKLTQEFNIWPDFH